MQIKLSKNIKIPPPKCAKRLPGFSLPEVILVLSIIGIVAGLIVPTLLNNIQQSQFNTGVWQADTMLSQAVEQLQANNGIVNVTSSNALRNDLCNVMQCVRTDTTANILSPISNPFYYSNYKSSTSSYNGAIDGSPTAILSNGMYILSINAIGSCTGNAGVNACAWLSVDINGPYQGPNMIGEDLHAFWIVLNNGIYSILPRGTSNDTTDTGSQSCNIGNWACACTYQRLYNPNNMP